MPFCWHCGKRTETNDITCAACGKQQAVAQPAEQEQPKVAPTPEIKAVAPASQNAPQLKDMPVLIPLGRVVLLSVLTDGLYMFWWAYITWKQYRDHTGKPVFPVWHALSLFVPGYGLLRLYAHVKEYRELLASAKVENSLSPGLAVFATVIIGALGGVGLALTWGREAEATRQLLATAMALNTISVVLLAAVLFNIQADLNKYWRSLKNVNVFATGLAPTELALVIFGVLGWAGTLGAISAAS